MAIFYKFDPITRRYAGTEESEGCPAYATPTPPNSANDVFDLINRTWVALAQPTEEELLFSAKAAKRQEIKADRDAACFKPVVALGRTWDADRHSQEFLNAAVTLAQAGFPLPAVWRDHDNNDMPVSSLDDLKAIAGAIAEQVQTAYATSWSRKAALEAATTLEAVAAV